MPTEYIPLAQHWKVKKSASVVVHIRAPSTWKAEAGELLRSRLPWAIWHDPVSKQTEKLKISSAKS